jgi:hypothetical protein
LQAGVHFEEVEAVLVVEQKLDGAGPGVLAGAGHFHGAAAHFGPQLGREHRRRRFLNHLLVAALNRAFALEQVYNVTVLVT